MKQNRKTSLSEQAQAVQEYYEWTTVEYYINVWSRDHIHFGIFEAGECPENSRALPDSEGLERGLVREVELTMAPTMIRQGQHVVDAGCGIGGTAIWLAQTTGCKVTGVNISRKQLDIAGKKAVDAGQDDKVTFKYADCSKNLPFADNSIDAVVNIESACHYVDRRQFLGEVDRILKPGGYLAGVEWLARNGITSEQYEDYIQPVCDRFILPSLESQDSYSRLIQEAGLEILEFEGFDGKELGNVQLLKYCCKDLATLWWAGRSTPETRAAHDKLTALHKAWDEGYFELRRFCAQKPLIT